MEDNYNTLCYCTSCVAERSDIEQQLKQFPPSMTQSSIANYLNVRYQQMRGKCLRDSSFSKKLSEDFDIYCHKGICESFSSVLKVATFGAIAVGLFLVVTMFLEIF